MNIADNPRKIPLPFADSAGGAYITNPIPTSSQIGISNGRASFETGFVPLNFVPISAGGVPPFGADFNGLLYQVTAGLRWLQAGGPIPYDATFVTEIGGYPQGAIIASATTLGLLWISEVDGNTTNPDAGGSDWISAPIGNSRTRLAANVNFYVATTGSDSNNGLTAGTPFLTIQKAASVIQNGYDLNGYVATINIAAGTYTAGAVINSSVPGAVSPGSIIFTASGTVIINAASYCFAANQGAMYTLAGSTFVLSATLSGGLGSAVIATGGSKVSIIGILNYGTCGISHVLAATGGQVQVLAQEIISGSALNSHYNCHAGGVISANGVGVTLTGTPTFAVGYATADECGILEAAGYVVLSGSAIGPIYNVSLNGVINTNGAAGLNFPGTSAGVQTTGGQVV